MNGPRFDPDQLPPELAAQLPTIEELLEGLPEVFKKCGPQHAVLDENGEPQIAGLMEWALWLEHNHHQRIISRNEIMRTGQNLVPELYCVSTVFLGLNHQYIPGEPPLWFETMVFGPPVLKYYEFLGGWRTEREDLWMRRYTTRTQALEGHAEALAWTRDYIAKLETRAYVCDPS